MKKFQGMLICTDLDGTLLRNDKSISRENLDAIEYFKSEGGVFTFVTGRMPYYVTDMCQRVNPNGPFGCINGGGVYDHRKQAYLWTRELSKAALELVEAAEKQLPEIGIQVCTLERTYFCRENSAMERFRRLTGVPNLTADYRAVKEPVGKIMFGDENGENIERLQKILTSHPMAKDFGFIRSERTLFEILPKGISKGTVLEKMAQLLDIDMRKTVAVGDYNNDAAMLKAAGIGIAVANAVSEAKAAADRITVSNEEHAIARIIADLDCGELKV